MRTDSQNAAPRGPSAGAGALPGLVLRSIHTAYAVALFIPLALLALAGMMLLPTLPARRRIARFTGRAALTLAGMPVSVRLPDDMPDPCIVVANHESYLDGIVLAATLPPRFAFVIKREVAGLPLAGWLLRRIGAQFVARGQKAGSARDALRVMREASRGHSLAFFPEGTFSPVPGLMRFHAGAFAAAELAGTPVLPLVLHGTRRCLPPGGALTRPGLIRVRALALLHPRGGTHDAATLRDAAHAAIAQALDPAPAEALGGIAVPDDDTSSGKG